MKKIELREDMTLREIYDAFRVNDREITQRVADEWRKQDESKKVPPRK